MRYFGPSSESHLSTAYNEGSLIGYKGKSLKFLHNEYFLTSSLEKTLTKMKELDEKKMFDVFCHEILANSFTLQGSVLMHW